MKHSKKPKKLQEHGGHPKFSCFLACFGGGQPSGKKLVFDHTKKSHHNHRWLLSPYWSKVRLKRSAPCSKTVPFELLNVSPSPTPLVTSKSLTGGKAAEYENIVVIEKTDPEIVLKSDDAVKSLNCKIQTSVDEGEEDLSQKTKNSDKRSNRTKSSPRIKKAFMPEEPNKNGSIQISKLDPLIGFSMVMLTLMIMMIWGRLCAILCASAWFYFVPRFQWKEDNSKSQNENMRMKFENDGKSWTMKDYKKRVILEGFLERENRQGSTEI